MSAALMIAEARAWIGTPYRHAGAAKGLGCDCLGLILGVGREVFGKARFPPVPFYPPDWAEASGQERLLDGLRKAFFSVDVAKAAMGDILLFRWRAGRPASHAGFLTDEGTLIHAHARAAVAEIDLTPAWRRRLIAAFRFPEIV